MKKNIITTLLFGFGAIVAITVQAQTIKIDTLNNDIVIPGDIERDHLEDDHFEKGEKTILNEGNEMQKVSGNALPLSPMAPPPSGGTFPNIYPNFKPCFCPVVINAPAIDPTATNSNIGFEVENLDKGISNWIFFMGTNYASIATVGKRAWFECEKYYTGDMVTPPGTTATGLEANKWQAHQYVDFEQRTAIMTMTSASQPTDGVGGFPVVPPPIGNTENKHALRLNNQNWYFPITSFQNYSPAIMAVKKIRVHKSDPYLAYKYALMVDNSAGHADGATSYFRLQVFSLKAGGNCTSSSSLNDCCDELCCEGVFINPYSINNIPGMVDVSAGYGKGKIKDWTLNTINFTPYFEPNETYHDFLIAVTAAWCAYSGHSGHAYLDLEPAVGIAHRGLLRAGSTITFESPAGSSYGVGGNQSAEQFRWKVYKVVSGSSDLLLYTSSWSSNDKLDYQFTSGGIYKVRVDVESGFTGSSCSTTEVSSCQKWFERTVEIEDGEPAFVLSCSDCIGSFAPLVNNKYVLSAWVKQDYIPASGTTTFTEPRIEVSYAFTGTPTPSIEIFIPSGPIIDGWQKIEKEFTIPANATSIQIDLKGYSTNTTGHNVYYDDIRVFPFRADMKSFVYDPTSQKLMAQMDENNYATFYEYDEEGKLKRVKKETERGVMTIKEAGSNSSKR